MYFTEKQLRIMEFIQSFRAERGIAPTLEEIARNFGVTKITIYEHINQLERKGAIRREKFRARSIEILAPVEERVPRFSLPLMGKLQEGDAIDASGGQDRVDLSALIPLGKNCYALRVVGDGMADEHITDGDYVIVEKSELEPANGDVVVALLDGRSATVKRYHKEKNRVSFHSTNGGGRSLTPKSAEICGKVVGVLRQYPNSVS